MNHLRRVVAGAAANRGPTNCKHTGAEPISWGHNIETDGSCVLAAAGDKPRTDPRISGFGDHDGPTDTYDLDSGSPAIDAGAGCTRAVRLPARFRRVARSFDVLEGKRTIARRRPPRAQVTVHRRAVTLRVRLRTGKTTLVWVRATCA